MAIQTNSATAEAVIAAWPEISREVAHTVIGKYGPPAEVSESKLVWFDNGPWKRTEVHASPVPHEWPDHHEDVVEQVIDYCVPDAMVSSLASFDGSVTVYGTRGEISAMCEGEEANFLALNLANEIIRKDKSITQARRDYEQKAQLMADRQSDPYLNGFVFELPGHAG